MNTLQPKAASEALALVTSAVRAHTSRANFLRREKTFTLQVPATNDTINQLIIEIGLTTCSPDERVTLKYGTCSLVCRDEAEAREFGTKVRVLEAVETLIASRN